MTSDTEWHGTVVSLCLNMDFQVDFTKFMYTQTNVDFGVFEIYLSEDACCKKKKMTIQVARKAASRCVTWEACKLFCS